MKVVSVRVRRNKAERPYEHKHVEVEVTLAEGDTTKEALAYAEFLVAQGLGEVDPRNIRQAAGYVRFLERETSKETDPDYGE